MVLLSPRVCSIGIHSCLFSICVGKSRAIMICSSKLGSWFCLFWSFLFTFKDSNTIYLHGGLSGWWDPWPKNAIWDGTDPGPSWKDERQTSPYFCSILSILLAIQWFLWNSQIFVETYYFTNIFKWKPISKGISYLLSVHFMCVCVWRVVLRDFCKYVYLLLNNTLIRM